MANKRVFWAVQAVCIVPMNDSGASLTEAHVVKGLQSAGITTNFELEQVFEMGQLSIYENIETIPDVEVTLEKVIDGHSLIYLMASPKGTGSISYVRTTGLMSTWASMPTLLITRVVLLLKVQYSAQACTYLQ